MGKRVPPPGKRPMIHPDDLDKIIDRPPVDFIVFDRTLPDGPILYYYGETRARPATQLYRTDNGLFVSWGKTPADDHGYLRCLTASYADHYPTWDEMRDLRQTFFPPTVDVMMVLPRESTPYINDHPYCLWLWETPTAWNWPSRDPAAMMQDSGIRIINDLESV